MILSLLIAERLAPLAQGYDHREQPFAFWREHVILPCASVGSRLDGENTKLYKSKESAGQDSFRNTKALLKFPETAYAIERIADDQQGPPIADHIKGPGDRTVGSLQADPFDHAVLLSKFGSKIRLDSISFNGFYYRTINGVRLMLPSPSEQVLCVSPQPYLSGAIVMLLAAACGLSVANVYYSAPLLDQIARDFHVAPGMIGSAITATQIGYGFGLLAVVPLGDLLPSRRLILRQGVATSISVAGVALAPFFVFLLISLFAVGLLSVLVQTLVAYAANRAAPTQRGRVVGQVTSGVVIGILCARIVAGALTDLIGWRAVYAVSAMLTAAMAVTLTALLPKQEAAETPLSYLALIRSTLRLYCDMPILRARGVMAFLIFAMFNALWAPLVLPLSAPPFSLPHTEIGLFGFAGLAGALGAGRAGAWADHGYARRTTILCFLLAVVSWVLIAGLPFSIWSLIVGVLLLDFAIQAIHVTSQSLILANARGVGSRIVGAYMTFYSLGSAIGAVLSTMIYAYAGWIGVSLFGGLLGLVGFFIAVSTMSENRPQGEE